MTGDEIRRRFLDFFEVREHLVLPSAKLQPDDPTTYFTTAGMQPFVPYFLGNERPPRHRLATCQKCLRSDDLDEVGYTARHLSYFEMLGNFSFGDYFKEEAIAWGWQFVLEGLELDPNRLWCTVYDKDDEAAEIWARHTDPARIVRMGMDDNWWGPVGNSGPCGPCSEILLDRGPEWGDADSPLEDEGGDRYVELWNLVFQQYNSSMSKADLKRTGEVPNPLPAPGIDTGAGLERIAAAMQGVSTVFECDLLKPLCDAVVDVANQNGKNVVYGQDQQTTAAVNRIADHSRALTFAVCDGMFPSNKAAGYVLRQILRRAARIGRLRLGLAEPFVYRLVDAVAARYEATYPEVREGQATAENIIRQEEERFAEALDTGIPHLEEILESLQGKGESAVSGAQAYHVYETFGVPIEVQVEIARDRGLTVDVDGFEEVRDTREGKAIAVGFEGHGDFADDLLADIEHTTFTGYDVTSGEAKLVALVAGAKLDEVRGLLVAGDLLETAGVGTELVIVLDQTPFYAESGGQIGDVGQLSAGDACFTVNDTHKDKNGRWLHSGVVSAGTLTAGATVTAEVDVDRRDRIRRAHTATHLLHAALRARLGKHVAQAGSLVEPDRLRFDFSHFSALSAEDLAAIEEHANQMVMANQPMLIREMPIDEARQLGAMMFFAEKYGSVVRVVNVGEEYGGTSTELCGGTHVQRTGDIGQVRVVAESSVGSGVRRLEALTGAAALGYAKEQEARLKAIAQALKSPVAETLERVNAVLQQTRELEKELAAVQQQSAAGQAAQLLQDAAEVGGVKVVAVALGELEVDAVKGLADDLCNHPEPTVALLGTGAGGKVVLVCKASDAAVAAGAHAGNTVKAAAQAAGGGGGGRPNFAQAGGRDPEKLDDAIAAGLATLQSQLG